MDLDDFMQPRGLESYVPALVRLRAEIWPHLTDRLKSLFEVADYIGLQPAIDLTAGEFVELKNSIPRDIWNRAVSDIDISGKRQLDRNYFRENNHGEMTIADIIGGMSEAMSARSR